MDIGLRDQIILAAAEEIMLDAASRFDEWVATRDSIKPGKKDPATAAAGELGIDFFAALSSIVDNIILSFPGGVMAGFVANEVTRRLHRAAPTLSVLIQPQL